MICCCNVLYAYLSMLFFLSIARCFHLSFYWIAFDIDYMAGSVQKGCWICDINICNFYLY